jgi:polysaccharide pyruvyl transferase WcaK-like protein/coenzyme F420-reducing hydrogenase beta subunit
MLPERSMLNIAKTVSNKLCIGCGLCSLACPEALITMVWQDRGTWEPVVDEGRCLHCGHCFNSCPHSPGCIVEYAVVAQATGARFGLSKEAHYFIAYDSDDKRRIRSASGGATTALLEHLLTSGAVNGVLASLPVAGAVGDPHFKMAIFRSAEELDQGRSSHYHPLSYDKVLGEVRESAGLFAVVGVPCVMRGLLRLPSELLAKIKYKLCLVCSHNVTGAFADCLACKEGVERRALWQINLRDKKGISDANNFNNLFVLPDREIRRNRFATAFTKMWRNYFFAQECCLYCADFYGVDADVSIKDAWGRLSSDPLGMSLVIVKNREIAEHLNQLKASGRLFLQKCDADEVFNSQNATPIFKHVKVRDRLVWKKSIKHELDNRYPSLDWSLRWFSRDSHEYWRLWLLMKLSKFFFGRFVEVPEKTLLLLVNLLTLNGAIVKRFFRRTNRLIARLWLRIGSPVVMSVFLFFGLCRPKRAVDKGRLKVLIAGGYGYGNVGDEAQLAANLQYWKKASPNCRLTVLTPNCEYTQNLHAPILVELAPRRALFGLGGLQYFGSKRVFKVAFFWIAAISLLNACLIRAGLPIFGLTIAQLRLIGELKDSDVLFLSGGGYLTGMTLTRLWDNMLLIRLAHALNVPVILSGQTIGVFKDPISRILAKWGLKKAQMIYLRDTVGSPRALDALGISDTKIGTTFDDALFFDGASSEQVDELLCEFGIDPQKPYVAVNVHYWGQSPESSRRIMKNMARSLDTIQKDLGSQIVFVPMAYPDEDAIEEVRATMVGKSSVPRHTYRPDLAVSIIQQAELCITMKHHPIIFAMAAAVPTIAMAFDDYYHHKNLGAMRTFNQEVFFLNNIIEDLDIQLSEMAKTAVLKKSEISESIRNVLEELRPLSGEVINKFVQNISV